MCSQTCDYVTRKDEHQGWQLDCDPEWGGLGISKWHCPHPPLGEEDGDKRFCAFHTETDVSADQQQEELLKALDEAGDRPRDKRPEHRGQFVGATFGAINLSSETITATDNYDIRFDHAQFQAEDEYLNFENTRFETQGRHPVSFVRAEFITDGDGDVVFTDTIFRTNADGSVRFSNATFRADGDGHVVFDNPMFRTNGDGSVRFSNATFRTSGDGDVMFDNPTFRTDGNGNVVFGDATFRTNGDGSVRFQEATFRTDGDGDVGFNHTTFRTGDGIVGFTDATFRPDGDSSVRFSNATFQTDGDGHVDFKDMMCKGDGHVEFNYTTFRTDGHVGFKGATLTNIHFQYVDFGEADLQGAELTGTDLRNANIAGVSVNGETTCKRLYEGYGADRSLLRCLRRLFEGPQFDSEDWDATAQAYHRLKTVFSDHGLVGKARSLYIRERRARSLEAKAEDDRLKRRYLRSLPPRIFTGYGIQISRLVFWMGLLFLISTRVYEVAGVNETLLENVSYSVLAFTVAPPHVPEGVGTQIVMMVETFFGTLSIVLLGYILGNRERF